MSYDSRKPLLSCKFEDLNRQVGVLVEEPFYHRGAEEQCVEVFAESVTVNTLTVGAIVPVAEQERKTIEYTERVIRSLDSLLVELRGHRERLAEERWHLVLQGGQVV